MIQSDTLDPIQFNKNYSYARIVPSLVCNSVSGTSEIARWVLDINEMLYDEKRHAPPFAEKKVNKWTAHDGLVNNPAYITNDVLVYGPESIIQYFDERLPEEKKLFPSDPTLQKEVVKLFKQFTFELETNVWQYLFTELFDSKKETKKWLKKGVPFGERLAFNLNYGGLKKRIKKQYNLTDKDAVVYLVEIQKVFTQVSDLLSDGRRFLTGERFTAADIAFAAVAAPILMPWEYGGSISKISLVSEEMRHELTKLQTTAAGQFLLGLYQEQRPINLNLGKVPKKPGLLKRILGGIAGSLAKGQWKAFYFLQKRLPVIKIGLAKAVIVSRHDLVVEVLERDLEFTVKETNGPKMAMQKGAFFLGFDRSNPQFDREREFVKKSAHREDMERVRKFIRAQADEFAAIAKPYGRLDVVQSLNYPVLINFMDDYFGVPPIVNSRMIKWQRTMFYDLFLNFLNSEKKHLAATNSGKERMAWVRNLITERKEKLAAGEEIGDNLLNRLIKLAQQEEYQWADDDTIRRQIGGLLTGVQETTSKAVIFVLEVLFSRPKELAEAIKAAKAYDMDTLLGYCMEALRFNPVQPGVLRFSETKQYLQGSGKKKYTIKEDRLVLTLTSGAMFDPVTFPDPKKFNPERKSRYMNWGFALHECYGKHINVISIPELVGAVLRLENVKPVKGAAGKGINAGPFPNNYVVQFDA